MTVKRFPALTTGSISLPLLPLPGRGRFCLVTDVLSGSDRRAGSWQSQYQSKEGLGYEGVSFPTEEPLGKGEYGLVILLSGVILSSLNRNLLNRLMSWRRRRGSFWLLILLLFALREIQTVHHKNEIKHTAVGTSQTLFDLIIVSFIDDIPWASYYKSKHQVKVKAAWMAEAVGTNFIEEIRHLTLNNEGDYQFLIQYLTTNDTKTESNHTLQIHFDCELDGDILLSSLLKYGLDGEDLIQIEGIEGQWVVLNPRAHSLKLILESPIWTEMRKHENKQYCVGAMQKILQKSSMKENLPPEVYVSRRDFPNGTIRFSCTATGFYPQSILLHWKKGSDGAIWGKESSSGTLPNSDDTFYLQISLEIQPGDTGTDYACVVDHSQLEAPAVYSVPEKPSKWNLWAVALSTLLAAILMISCFVIFTKWKKRRSGTTSEAQLEGPFRSSVTSPVIRLQ
ncbi:hereditary hemochromatosis protein homolog [Trichosurus vulpecula]|uniref:hereditary hemochromatosis protein homolog n=1 Tax=Trichosurus vulpecula TaxID=9337 RepID=UPI00186AFBF0|nr:hereditary hemochromatosis protein homolog [Trichosurus vulpecula]